MTKLPALTPDDPLRAVASPQPEQAATPHDGRETPVAQRRRAAPRTPPPPPPTPSPDKAPQAPPEEEWSGVTDVTTFRLPAEVLQALHERSRQLGVAKGMTVAAALLELLQRTDDELVGLVENTQQRYDSARRRARRAA